MKNFIVLGHTGFIGSALKAALPRFYPECTLQGLSSADIDLTTADAYQKLIPHLHSNSTLIICNGIKKQWGDTLQNYESNMAMALNFCKALESHPVKQVIYLSSADVYGEEVNNRCITEKTTVELTSFYGMAKYATECLLSKTMSRLPESALMILRPPLIYGVGDHSYGYGPTGFIRSALRGEKITLWGDGCELRQFVYIDDLANIVCRLADGDHRGIVNIADGHSASFLDILRILSSMPSLKLTMDSKPRSRKMVDHVYDNTLLKKMLPDMAFTSLDKGIRLTFDAMQKVVHD